VELVIGLIILIFGGGLFFGFALEAVYAFNRYQCSNCKKWFAMHPTGSYGLPNKYLGDEDTKLIESKCKYCGHIGWEEIEPPAM